MSHVAECTSGPSRDDSPVMYKRTKVTGHTGKSLYPNFAHICTYDCFQLRPTNPFTPSFDSTPHTSSLVHGLSKLIYLLILLLSLSPPPSQRI